MQICYRRHQPIKQTVRKGRINQKEKLMIYLNEKIHRTKCISRPQASH